MNIEKLKELEQEAMDSIDIDTYDDITGDVLDDYRRPIYLCGYIDGLQTAIRTLSEDDSSMSYTIEIDEMFGEDYAKADDDEDNIQNTNTFG
jgi:hypothetical protein